MEININSGSHCSKVHIIVLLDYYITDNNIQEKYIEIKHGNIISKAKCNLVQTGHFRQKKKNYILFCLMTDGRTHILTLSELCQVEGTLVETIYLNTHVSVGKYEINV